VTAFIDGHRNRFGVEPICRVLTEHGCKIAPSTYYAAKSRAVSARAVRDAELKPLIAAVHADREKGRGVAGVRKVWHHLRRDGVVVARCTVARLMRELGLRGVVRGRQFITTRPDPAPAAPRPPDLVDRVFTASRPNQLWVVDFTYAATATRMGFTAFVCDVYSRRIVGWRTADRMPTELPLDALEMALWVRGRAGHSVDGVVHHSDAGSSVHRDPLLHPAPRCWCGRLDQVGRGLLRQRHGRVGHRPVQERMRQDRRAVHDRRRTRARHPLLGALVQRAPVALLDRLLATSRVRTGLLPPNRLPAAPAAGRTDPPLKPMCILPAPLCCQAVVCGVLSREVFRLG